MKLQALLSLTFLGAITAVQATTMDVTDVLRNLTSDPLGHKHLGDDGVARSFSPNGTVIDAVGLSNTLLMEAARGHKDPKEQKHLMELWAGVNGNDVPHRRRYSPPKDLLPALFKDPELVKELKQKHKEQKARYGQSPNKRDSVLDSDPTCVQVACFTREDCILVGCIDCITYDELRASRCI
ncbi:hypothetical protein EMPG_12679 [Blastomyces silverae]|uniref:Uncharacterized protein n=1 Tax=Blastomyces silverae TaxID=2060906 RepID=A0A0H1BMG4_9EURO|nr:hypothetical protein EMPG_12679 [Blastomyces silverae]